MRKRLTPPIIDQIPETSGVYAFWCSRIPRCVYVGKSNKLRRRILEHWKRHSRNKKLDRWIDRNLKEMEFCYREFAVSKMEDIEVALIKKLNPHANTKHKKR